MRNLNLDQLQALGEVVALGSFSAAAQKLRLTQPAVSLQIRELEKRLGVRLIERMGKRAYATAAGEELVEHARRLAQDAEQAISAMRRHRDGWLGRARLGTSVAVCTYLLPPVLVNLRRDYPDLEVVISVGTTENVVSRILANDLDIGVVTMPIKENPAIEVERLREDPMMGFFPGGERNLPKQATPQYLAGRNLILNQRLSQTYKIIAGWFEAAGIELRPIMELGNTEAIKTLVAAGIGVGILPLERKQGILVYGRTQVRPLQPVLMRQLGIVRRRGKTIETGLKIVYEALLTLAKRRNCRRRIRKSADSSPPSLGHERRNAERSPLRLASHNFPPSQPENGGRGRNIRTLLRRTTLDVPSRSGKPGIDSCGPRDPLGGNNGPQGAAQRGEPQAVQPALGRARKQRQREAQGEPESGPRRRKLRRRARQKYRDLRIIAAERVGMHRTNSNVSD